MKTTATPRALALLALVLIPALLPSCQRSNDPTPTTARQAASNASAAAEALLPCMSESPEYGPDANGLGSYHQSTPRSKNMGTVVTNMGRDFFMEQVKYLITPSGKEHSVWQGTDDLTAPASKTDYNTTVWSECGKQYDSKCVRWPDGRVTLTLTSK